MMSDITANKFIFNFVLRTEQISESNGNKKNPSEKKDIGKTKKIYFIVILKALQLFEELFHTVFTEG